MVNIKFSGTVPMTIFKFRAADQDFEDTWEKGYVQELIATLKPGMTVYDIGAENGETTVLAGKLVGGEKVHIFEPNESYFPNIKAIWNANNLKKPASSFNGYVYEESSEIAYYQNFEMLGYGDIFHGCLHPNHIDTPMQTISIDDHCKNFELPDVVIMDIEGGELAAVRGAINTIQNHSPIFFISIHEKWFIKHRSNGTKQDLIDIFIENGYDAIHLSTDHEEHWKFIKHE